MPQMSPMKWSLLLTIIFLFSLMFLTILSTTPLVVKVPKISEGFIKSKWKFLW